MQETDPEAPAAEPEPKPQPAGPEPEPDPAVAPEVPAIPAEPVPEPVPDVMSMLTEQPGMVLANPSLTAQALEVMSDMLEAAQRRRKLLDKEIDDLNAKNEWLKRVQSRQPVPKAAPPFLAVHETMRRESEERAARRAALKHVSTKDLRDMTRTGSKLDEVLGMRRPGVDGLRPAARMAGNA